MNDCPICGDHHGFHHDDCGSNVQVPRHLVLPAKEETGRVKLTDEEIAQRRAESAERKLAKERAGS